MLWLILGTALGADVSGKLKGPKGAFEPTSCKVMKKDGLRGVVLSTPKKALFVLSAPRGGSTAHLQKVGGDSKKLGKGTCATLSLKKGFAKVSCGPYSGKIKFSGCGAGANNGPGAQNLWPTFWSWFM